MDLHLGVTGTRNGMNNIQKENLEKVIEAFLFELGVTSRILHQGQCVGVDVEVARLLKKKFGFKVISHPPIKKDLIGICENDEIKSPKSYFARNRDIVDSCDILLVIPKENKRQNFGGTWYTHDYAKKQKVIYYILYPNGEIFVSK